MPFLCSTKLIPGQELEQRVVERRCCLHCRCMAAFRYHDKFRSGDTASHRAGGNFIEWPRQFADGDDRWHLDLAQLLAGDRRRGWRGKGNWQRARIIKEHRANGWWYCIEEIGLAIYAIEKTLDGPRGGAGFDRCGGGSRHGCTILRRGFEIRRIANKGKCRRLVKEETVHK